MSEYLFTSESVTEGHPDKMADQISDAILDTALASHPEARVACETLVKTGFVVVAGEITTTARIEFPRVVRDVVRDIGYVSSEIGFDAETCAVLVAVEEQSPDIDIGVTKADPREQGAGDQGMMFGYASDETEALMPMPIHLAHRLTQRLAEVRRDGTLPFLRPDGKAQVTLRYVDDRPTTIEAIVVSTQHDESVSLADLEEAVRAHVVAPVVDPDRLHAGTRYHINPTGRFVVGGPKGDAGVTGRKIVVDTYGGMGRHGGGAFSGKDPSKVDRSAAYMARLVAKNVVAAGLARRCEVQLAYAIGVAEPVSVMVHTFGTGTIPEVEIARRVREVFGLKPREIIETLDLLRPIYRRTASYGHFGRPEFPWEATRFAERLRA